MKDPASQPTRDRFEARITALLLGELDEREAARVRESIGADPALQRLHRELSDVVDALREAPEALSEASVDRAAAPKRLSELKRRAVLERFRILKAESPEVAWWKAGPWYVPLGVAAVAVLLMGGLALLLLPGGIRAKPKTLAASDTLSRPMSPEGRLELEPRVLGERFPFERSAAKAPAPADGPSSQSGLAPEGTGNLRSGGASARSRLAAPSAAPAPRVRQEIFLPARVEPESEEVATWLAIPVPRPNAAVDGLASMGGVAGYALFTPAPDGSGENGGAVGGRNAWHKQAEANSPDFIDKGGPLSSDREGVVRGWNIAEAAEGETASAKVAEAKLRSDPFGLESAGQQLAEAFEVGDDLGLGGQVEALFAGGYDALRTSGPRSANGDQPAAGATRGYAGGMGGGGFGGGGGFDAFGRAPAGGLGAQGGAAPSMGQPRRATDLSLGRALAGVVAEPGSRPASVDEGRQLEAARRGGERRSAVLADLPQQRRLNRKSSSDPKSEGIAFGVQRELESIAAVPPRQPTTSTTFAAVVEPETARPVTKEALGEAFGAGIERDLRRQRGRASAKPVAKGVPMSWRLADADRIESGNGVALPEVETRLKVLDEDLKLDVSREQAIAMDDSASVEPASEHFAYFTAPEIGQRLEEDSEQVDALGLVALLTDGSGRPDSGGAEVVDHAWGFQSKPDAPPQAGFMARYGLAPGGSQPPRGSVRAGSAATARDWGDYDTNGRAELQLGKAIEKLKSHSANYGEARKLGEIASGESGHGVMLGDAPSLGSYFRPPAVQAEPSLSEAEPSPAPVSELSRLAMPSGLEMGRGTVSQKAARGEIRADPRSESDPSALAKLATEMDFYDRRGESASRSRFARRSGLVQERVEDVQGLGRVAVPDERIEALERAVELTKGFANNRGVERADTARESRQAQPVPAPRPEVATRDNPYSTFSLNVTDVSFKLAAASLEQARMPEAPTIRAEEFINAFDYHDPEPPAGKPIALDWERSRYPFAHNREIIRFGVTTAAAGREANRPLNLVLLVDNSGSMERADRVSILDQALRVLARQLQPRDRISVIAFARTARLWVDGAPGGDPAGLIDRVRRLAPEGGTNLEDALRLAYETASRHYRSEGVNRVILLTDGAANLGNVEPEALKRTVQAHRKQGIALDCFGVGWEGYNDDLLEALSGSGDGRYGFLNSTTEAETDFADELAGALRVAAADVKVQVEFNPDRVVSYRQIGYAKHQLTKEQFRDNTVDAAEIGATESGNALYTLELAPEGQGPIGTVRVRYRVPHTQVYEEHEWLIDYAGPAIRCEQASPALRLAVVAAAFAQWLASSPFAAEVTTDRLLRLLTGVPDAFPLDARPARLRAMIRQAGSITGR